MAVVRPPLLLHIAVQNHSFDIHIMVGDIMSMTALENLQIYIYLKPVFIFAVSVIVSLITNRILMAKKVKAVKGEKYENQC